MIPSNSNFFIGAVSINTLFLRSMFAHKFQIKNRNKYNQVVSRTHVQCPFPIATNNNLNYPPGSCPLSVADSNAGRGSGDGGQDLVVLFDVDNGRTRGTNSRSRVSGSHGIRESDSAKVGKGDERAILFKVLYDPLSVLLAQGGGRTEGFGDGLSCRDVLDDSCPGCGGGSGYSGGDDIASTNGDAGKIVGEIWEPFIPCF